MATSKHTSGLIFGAEPDGPAALAVASQTTKSSNSSSGSPKSMGAIDSGPQASPITIQGYVGVGVQRESFNVSNPTVPNYIDGGGGSDFINAYNANDYLIGGGDRDIILGLGGNDTIIGDKAWEDNSTGGVTQTDAGADYLSGGDGDDVIAAGGGRNFVDGGNGQDYIVGGSGAEFLQGGAGDDIVAGLDGNDVIYGGSATSAVQTSAITNTFGAALLWDINGLTNAASSGSFNPETADEVLVGTGDDVLYGGGGSDTLHGQDGADILWGGAGFDQLNGGDGLDALYGGDDSDELNGGAGADILNGGDQIDYADYRTASAAVIADLQFSSQNTGDALGDTYIDLEGIDGTNFNDSLRGDSGANFLYAYDGNDEIYGRDGSDYIYAGSGTDILSGDAGNDFLFGGIGNDLLYGGLGADTMYGGDGTDTASYLYSTVGLTADLQFASTQNNAEAAGDIFDSLENLEGSAYSDSLRGDAGANRLIGGGGADALFGRDGDDLLDGGAGGDQLYGAAGIDSADYTSSATGIVVDLQFAASQNNGDAAGDTYAEIEGLVGSAFADSLRGDGGNNILQGGGGADTLFGRDGVDTLNGGNGDDVLNGDAGDDSLNGGEGNDIMFGGAGADTLNGGTGAGIDRASYAYSATGLTVDLQFSATQNSGEAVGDTYTNIIAIAGSSFDDSLRGDASANLLLGNAGNDTLFGRDGGDVLSGGAGVDTLYGGAGNDFFMFNAGDGNDIIADFVAGSDSILLDRSAFGFGSIVGSLSALTAANADFITSGTTATSVKPTFFWNAGTGLLLFDVDGTGAGGAVTLATLTGGASLTLASIYTQVAESYLVAAPAEPVSKTTGPATLVAADYPGSESAASGEAFVFSNDKLLSLVLADDRADAPGSVLDNDPFSSPAPTESFAINLSLDINHVTSPWAEASGQYHWM